MSRTVILPEVPSPLSDAVNLLSLSKNSKAGENFPPAFFFVVRSCEQ